MNLSTEMVPGLTLLLMGAGLTLFGDKVVVRAKNTHSVRVLGVCLAFAGAIMVFLA